VAELSPAARSVLVAVRYEVDAECYSPWIAAAALRAAADHIYHDCSAFNCIDSLYEIAAELEDM
jgi:hypothetical protein